MRTYCITQEKKRRYRTYINLKNTFQYTLSADKCSIWFHLYKIPRLVKFIELESRVVVTRGSGEEVEKGMAPHSSTPAWRIPWTEGSCRLQSVGLLRVGHDWATSLSLSTFMHWRRKWQPTPIFVPGEPQGQRSLVGYHLWGRKTEVT